MSLSPVESIVFHMRFEYVQSNVRKEVTASGKYGALKHLCEFPPAWNKLKSYQRRSTDDKMAFGTGLD